MCIWVCAWEAVPKGQAAGTECGLVGDCPESRAGEGSACCSVYGSSLLSIPFVYCIPLE